MRRAELSPTLPHSQAARAVSYGDYRPAVAHDDVASILMAPSLPRSGISKLPRAISRHPALTVVTARSHLRTGWRW
jgi:hypothetical protein